LGVLTSTAALFNAIASRLGRPPARRDAIADDPPDAVPAEADPPIPRITGSGHGTAGIARYDQWTEAVFGQKIPIPGVLFAASFAGDSVWGQKTHEALLNVELAYVEHLCRQLKNNDVPGALVEFGVFEGWWINHFYEVCEKLGLDRPVIGYDSFQGLSSPHPVHDDAFWQAGQYAASLDAVSRNVKLAERRRIKLIPGFFSDSLRTPDAVAVGEIAYARIDCDIYEPALDCLRYLGPRLADGAVLVLDDWPHRLEVGEARAFHDWASTVPHLRFEFLFFGTWGHFYTRVWHHDPASPGGTLTP